MPYRGSVMHTGVGASPYKMSAAALRMALAFGLQVRMPACTWRAGPAQGSQHDHFACTPGAATNTVNQGQANRCGSCRANKPIKLEIEEFAESMHDRASECGGAALAAALADVQRLCLPVSSS